MKFTFNRVPLEGLEKEVEVRSLEQLEELAKQVTFEKTYLQRLRNYFNGNRDPVPFYFFPPKNR